MSHASREEAQALKKELLGADIALFNGLGAYFAGVAQIQQAELDETVSDKSEVEGFKKAARTFKQALKQIRSVQEYEDRIAKLAEPIKYSAYFVRRHQVLSEDTTALRAGLEEMVEDLSEGFYPVNACSVLNPVVARIMANIQLNARVEGIVSRIESSGQKR